MNKTALKICQTCKHWVPLDEDKGECIESESHIYIHRSNKTIEVYSYDVKFYDSGCSLWKDIDDQR